MKRAFRLMRWWDWLTLAVLLAFAVVSIAALAVRNTIARKPPIEIESVEALNSPVVAGGGLVVRIHRQKNRSCPLTSTRWIVDQDGRKTKIEGRAGVKGGPVGASYVDVAYPIPPTTPSGPYLLQVRLLYDCLEAVYAIDQPAVPFRVRP